MVESGTRTNYAELTRLFWESSGEEVGGLAENIIRAIKAARSPRTAAILVFYESACEYASARTH